MGESESGFKGVEVRQADWKRMEGLKQKGVEMGKQSLWLHTRGVRGTEYIAVKWKKMACLEHSGLVSSYVRQRYTECFVGL